MVNLVGGRERFICLFHRIIDDRIEKYDGRFLKVGFPHERRLCRSVVKGEAVPCRLCPIRLPFILFSILSSIILWSIYIICLSLQPNLPMAEVQLSKGGIALFSLLHTFRTFKRPFALLAIALFRYRC